MLQLKYIYLLSQSIIAEMNYKKIKIEIWVRINEHSGRTLEIKVNILS